MLDHMRAALIDEIPTEVFRIATAAVPQLGDHDLLVRVAACGVCGTDAHIMAGSSFRPDLPFVLGHEPAGAVVQVGSSVGVSWLGRRVMCTIFSGCAHCSLCRAGNERLCQSMQAVTGALERGGGYAEYVAIEASQAVDIPAGLSDIDGASIADSGPTAVNAVRSASIRDGDRVVIVGGGPIAFLSSQLVGMKEGLSVVVVVRNEAKAVEFRSAGIATVRSLGEIEQAADVVIDCTGSGTILPWTVETLAPHGRYVAVGFAVIEKLDLLPIVRKELRVSGVRSGTRTDLVSILDLAASGRISLPGVRTFGLDAINAAFNHHRSGEPGKAVIVP